jgi:hypothetical protein
MAASHDNRASHPPIAPRVCLDRPAGLQHPHSADRRQRRIGRLLRGTAPPDLAIFFDGLNEFAYREPAMTPALTRMVHEATAGGLLDRAADFAAALPVASLPLLRSRVGQEAGESIHLFADPVAFAGWGTAEGYALVDKLRAAGKLGDDFLWLGDLQAGRRENLYVDRYHYDAKFSAAIASAVAAAARERIPCPPPRS